MHLYWFVYHIINYDLIFLSLHLSLILDLPWFCVCIKLPCYCSLVNNQYSPLAKKICVSHQRTTLTDEYYGRKDGFMHEVGGEKMV